MNRIQLVSSLALGLAALLPSVASALPEGGRGGLASPGYHSYDVPKSVATRNIVTRLEQMTGVKGWHVTFTSRTPHNNHYVAKSSVYTRLARAEWAKTYGDAKPGPITAVKGVVNPFFNYGPEGVNVQFGGTMRFDVARK